MRANLDVLEEWAKDNNLSAPFDEYLAKFKSRGGFTGNAKITTSTG